MGELIAGLGVGATSEGTIGVCAVTTCAPRPPHVLVTITGIEESKSIRLSAAQAMALAEAIPSVARLVKHAEVAVAAGQEPTDPYEEFAE